MWNRVGYLSLFTCTIPSISMQPAGIGNPSHPEEKTKDIHLVCLKHEISNLITREGYGNIFYHNLFGGDTTNVALFDFQDLRPFLVNCVDIIDEILSVGRKRLGI